MNASCTFSDMDSTIPLTENGSLRQLIVVIGNTSTSMVLFGVASHPVTERIPTARLADAASMNSLLDMLLNHHGPFDEAAICSVVPEVARRCTAGLASVLDLPVMVVGASLRLPFRLDYENGNSFGADRIALCAWSQQLFPGEAHIAIDIGTATTFDVMNAQCEYLGGLIMPGIDMMAGALHASTAQLPLVRIDRSCTLLGRSTAECIKNGIFWGVVMQIRGLIGEIKHYLKSKHGAQKIGVLVTGGNSELVARELGFPVIVDELAVARGSRLLLDLNRA